VREPLEAIERLQNPFAAEPLFVALFGNGAIGEYATSGDYGEPRPDLGVDATV